MALLPPSPPLRILLTNDDGINAEGLKILEKIAKTLSSDVWIVAPEVEQSGAGHSVTINSPLRARKISARKFAVNGTPTDCVLMAVRALLPKYKKIDLVLSGINRGQNVAEDITHSGTIAGAMEGTLCDIPSIAFSQKIDYSRQNPVMHWNTGLHHAPDLIRSLLAAGFVRDTLYNVNFPDCTADKVRGVKVVAHGKREIPKQLKGSVDPKGRDYYWLTWAEEGADPRRPDADIKWLSEDYITVTPICLDLTNYNRLETLKGTLEK